MAVAKRGAGGRAVTGMLAPAALERISWTGSEDFHDRVLAAGHPVVLTGAVTGWRALRLWEPEYLKERVGERPVPVFRSASRVFRPDPESGFDAMKEEIPFGTYCERLGSGGWGDGCFRYLSTLSLRDNFPELAQDFDFDWVLDREASYLPCLWLGEGGTVTPLHFDPFPAHNFLCQVRGRKRVTVLAPEDSARLYPYPERIEQFSQVDLREPDIERFPLLAEARAWEAVIEPGDVLYMPPRWWHEVESLELSVSVNVWWKEEMMAPGEDVQ